MKLHTVALAAFAFSVVPQSRGGGVDFSCKPLLFGRASMTGNGFMEIRTLGRASFSPELQVPVQLVYDSQSEETGIAGFAWSIPQFESRVRWDKDGMLWISPWGERLKFFDKKNSADAKDTISVPYLDAEKSGRGWYAPYSEWEAFPDGRNAAGKTGNWTVSGRRGNKGWKFVYESGSLSAVESPAGRKVVFSYSKDGKLVEVSQSGVPFFEISYTETGLVSSLVASGITNRFSYETSCLAILPKTPAGFVVAASRPRLRSVATADLDPVEFSYEGNFLSGMSQGRFSEKLAVDGAPKTAELAAKALKNPKIKPPANFGCGRILSDGTFKYHYESPGYVQTVDAADRIRSLTYDGKNGSLASVDEAGRRTTVHYFMRYDTAYMGRVRQIINERGQQIAGFRYDPMTGAIVRFRDRTGNDTCFDYDAAGNLVRTSRRRARSAEKEPIVAYGRDSFGNATSVSRLDAKGNPVATATARYDEKGQLISFYGANGRTTFSYTASGFPSAVCNGYGQKFTVGYDKFNRCVSTIDDFGCVTTYAYNSSGRVGRIERRDGANQSIVLSLLEIDYDGAGRPVAWRDASGREKRLERDEFGRIAKEFFPGNETVEYSYDAVGRLVSVLDENKHSISFAWDKFGLKSETTATGQITEFVSDEYGLLASVKAGEPDMPGRPDMIGCDQFDRLLNIGYPDGTEKHFTYDAWSRFSSISDGTRKATFRYDYFGNLVEKNDGGAVFRYAYDNWGRRTGMTAECDNPAVLRRIRGENGEVSATVVEHGKTFFRETRSYDDAGRLVSVRTPEDSVSIEYDSHNRVKRQIVNGVKITFAYDKYGRLSGKRLVGPSPGKEGLSVLFEISYVYDPLGRPASRTVNGEFQKFEYDGRDRIIGVVAKNGTDIERYRYDGAGNVLEKTVRGVKMTFTYDEANQLATRTDSGGTVEFGYDGAGRMVKEGDKTFVYGNDGRVIRVEKAGTTVASFEYFLDGQVASVTVGDRTERFLWDGLALIARGNRTFVNEPAQTGGNPIASGGRVFLNDMLGSTVGIHDGKKKTDVRVTMSVFGETSNGESFFTGKPNIPELGYAFLMRFYRSDFGKWLSRDPIGYADGWNALSYCKGQVSFSSDLFGCFSYQEPPDPGHERMYLGSRDSLFGSYEYFAVTTYQYYWVNVDTDSTVNISNVPTEVSLTFTTATAHEIGWKSQWEESVASSLGARLSAGFVSGGGSSSVSYKTQLAVLESNSTTSTKTKTISCELPGRTEWTVETYQLFCNVNVFLEILHNGRSDYEHVRTTYAVHLTSTKTLSAMRKLAE